MHAGRLFENLMFGKFASHFAHSTKFAPLWIIKHLTKFICDFSVLLMGTFKILWMLGKNNCWGDKIIVGVKWIIFSPQQLFFHNYVISNRKTERCDDSRTIFIQSGHLTKVFALLSRDGANEIKGTPIMDLFLFPRGRVKWISKRLICPINNSFPSSPKSNHLTVHVDPR